MAKHWMLMASAVAVLTAGPVAAQSASNGPAEFPPASFDGNQFVDSEGCAFIRAGVGGATNWVPRVSRSRDPLCNFQPTFPTGVAGPAPSGLVAPLDAPIIEITPPASAPAEVAAAPTPAPAPARAPVRAARPAPAVGAPIQTVASIPATPRIVAPEPVAAPEPPRTTLAEACDGRFGIQPGFVSARTGEPIDCGPAPVAAAPAAAPLPTIAPAPVPAPALGTPDAPLRLTLTEVCARMATDNLRYVRPDGTPIVCEAPAPVIAQAPVVAPVVAPPVVAPAPVAVSSTACPNSPHLQTVGGLPVRCGPQAAKPYTIVSGGPAATANSRVSTSGAALFGQTPVPASNPVRATPQTAPTPPAGYTAVWTDGRINPQRGLPTARAAQTQQPSAVRVSTRSATAPAAVQAPAAAATGNGHRYVQVGTFGDPANAERMIARLAAMGYPVASQRSGGLKIIAAGPFSDPTRLNSALRAVRGMGFGDAFTRN